MFDPIIEIHPEDKMVDPYYCRWSYCYLHGEAENIMGVTETAPDMFSANYIKPSVPGNYLCSIQGKAAIAFLRMHHGILSGRVVLITDNNAMVHALNEQDWL